MNTLSRLSMAIALSMLGAHAASASTAYGDLNNFDTVNDTGQETHGFEVEIDGARSTDITYTYDWNHYGAPRIREDLSDAANPKVFVRYESTQNADGSWASFTAVPAAPLSPTDGHSCTDPSVNFGCEHFGVGYYGTPTAIKYNWLIDSGSGTLVNGPAVNVATPTWMPVAANPVLPPDPVANPIVQVVAVIPAPVVPAPVGAPQQFGEPSWVKVIKTTTHNANNVALADLISDDSDGDGLAQWQNGEPNEVESEWTLLQTNDGANAAKNELAAKVPDEMPNGNETVTRRYEFYKYAGNASTIDGETGEAMCDEVGPDGIHGLRSTVGVTDANGDTQYVDCTAQVVVGDYAGAQMAGFDAEAPLGLVDHLQDAEPAVAYTPRTVVIGGNSPYVINITNGNLPAGMTLGDYVDATSGAVLPGVLAGIPTTAGSYAFTLEATDADGAVVSKAFTLQVGVAGPQQQYTLGVSAMGTGTGSVAGSGIDCGVTCSVVLDAGTTATLTATPAPGSVFTGWSGACTGTGTCSVLLSSTDVSVTATFDKLQYSLAVSKSGTGTGTVAGNGVDCGTTCSAQLAAGTVVTLAATPDAGSVFTGWSGACTGTSACTITLNADTAVTANFVPSTQKFALSVTKSGAGTVTSSPVGILCGKKCSANYAVGKSVKLTARTTKKQKFLGWGGACISSGTAPTCTVKMMNAQSVIATFN